MPATPVKPGLPRNSSPTVAGLLAIMAKIARRSGRIRKAVQFAVPLGSLGGTYSWARGINNKGRATGRRRRRAVPRAHSSTPVPP